MGVQYESLDFRKSSLDQLHFPYCYGFCYCSGFCRRSDPHKTRTTEKSFLLHRASSLIKRLLYIGIPLLNPYALLMPIYTRLQVPSFDLEWLQLPSKMEITNEESNFSTSTANEFVVLIPGGGGSAKTGVKNMVQVAKPTRSGVFEYLRSFDTGVKLCTSVSSGLVEKADANITVVCLGFDDGTCTLLEVSINEEAPKADKNNVYYSPDIEFIELTSFRADLAVKDSFIKCSQIFLNGTIATGGEDGVCRLWKLSHNDQRWTVIRECDLSKQKGPITAIACHPFKAWICVSSKDGSINVVNTETCKVIGNAYSSVPYECSNSMQKIECKGACFSISGNNLFSIQCARRGISHLVKWTISSSLKEEAKEIGSTTGDSPGKDYNGDIAMRLSIIPEKVLEVCRFPITSLCSSVVSPSSSIKSDVEDESCLAVGAADGSIVVVRQKTLSKVLVMPCHEFPVTGMGFSPKSFGLNGADGSQILVTCSADNAMAVTYIASWNTTYMYILFVILVLLITAASIISFHSPAELLNIDLDNLWRSN